GLYALPETCEETPTCEPLWIAADPENHVAHAPAVSGGVVWDSSSHALRAFPTACPTSGTTCEALVDGLRPGGVDLASGPAVADGVLYVGASDGTVEAVSTTCAGGGSC